MPSYGEVRRNHRELMGKQPQTNSPLPSKVYCRSCTKMIYVKDQTELSYIEANDFLQHHAKENCNIIQEG